MGVAKRMLLKLFVSSILIVAGSSIADEVVFLNGDRLTGKIVSLADGELILETEGAGEVTIKLEKVKTFSIDQPVKIRVGDKKPFESKVIAGSPGNVKTDASSAPLPIAEITAINPPVPAWHGAFAVNGLWVTGNAERREIGFDFELSKKWENDRLLFRGEYFYGRENNATTDDYGEGVAKYERDIVGQLYAEAKFKVQHNERAELEYRLMPSVGLGYRWFESPEFTFFTEAAIAWVDERYDTFGRREYWGPLLAYGLEWHPVKRLELFHTLEYLPSFSEFTDNYLLNIDAGIHVSVWRGFFVEFRAEYRYDSEPPGSTHEADTRLILGPGWEF
jgi:hypothetical protein